MSRQATRDKSGLRDGYYRICFSCRQQPCTPRVRACRRDWTLRERDLGRRRHARRDRLIRERPAFVGHPHRPLYPFFDHDVGRPSHVALEAVHHRGGDFVRIEACTHPAVRIVDVGH